MKLTRPHILRLAFGLFLLARVACPAAETAGARAKPNILFIVADDLNDWVGCLGGHPQVQTPNIDQLAARGTLFADAHCQAPLCTPSRNSFLTGLRPTTLGSYGLKPGIRELAPAKEAVTLPQAFRRAGYFTWIGGKVFHDGTVTPAQRPQEAEAWGPAPPARRPAKFIASLPESRHPAMDWGPFPERDEDQCDYVIASAAAEALRTAPADRPFFLACGFRMPHVPCLVPQKWFDLYPDATLKLPAVRDDDRDDTPRFSWYLHWKLTEPRLKLLQERHEWRPLVRSYLACVSYLDAQVGRVLAALEASGRAANTLVVFTSDHGWHLGEKGITGKNSLWERATRVPLIVAGPGVAGGARCARPAELLDLFPTLLDLAGLPATPGLEGHTLAPQCRDARAPRAWPAITTHNAGNHAVRSERWRYIHYADGSEELYDHESDPNEWTNLAARPEFAAIKRELKAWLPAHELPPALPNEKRVLTYDAATDTATWEGEPVHRSDPIPQGLYSYP